ncbi:3-isopropylmalate dehydratase small subunit [Candidatus Margulisiibacteriota bacterium]
MIIKKISGTTVPILGDDIDTDQIMPARYLKEITFERMGDFLFYDLRYDEDGKSKNFILDKTEYKNASFIFTGKNFGCGSSREHAPQGIKRFGIKAIIGESFAEIFSGNSTALGIPLVTASKKDLEILYKQAESKPEIQYELDLEAKTISFENIIIAINLSEPRRQAFINGNWDIVETLKKNSSKIDEKMKDLGYIK